MIANGANGKLGHLVQLPVALEINSGLVLLPNKLSTLANNVLEEHFKQSNVTILHVQLIVNGVHGLLGHLVPKGVALELNKDLALLFKRH